MSVHSHRTMSSRYRDAINLTSSVFSKRGRHLWIGSQLHCRDLRVRFDSFELPLVVYTLVEKTIFLMMQILLIFSSLAVMLTSFPTLSYKFTLTHFFCVTSAYAGFFGAIAGIWALKLADNIYQAGCRVSSHCIIPPKLAIIPSFIVQVVWAILSACAFFGYLIHVKDKSFLFLVFGVLIPVLLICLIIFYILAAEIDCFIYVIHRSRHWHRSRHPAPLLNMHSLNDDRYSFESPSKRHLHAMDTSQEHERTKSSVSAETPDSGSLKLRNGVETRIEVFSPKYTVDDGTAFFSEYSRKTISMGNFHLDTVPEESSKSTNSQY
uniref:Uncharacterized protein n=1 Tax=Setaria digitata TaxID=48799 RepID=A0A915PPX0_9BILA